MVIRRQYNEKRIIINRGIIKRTFSRNESLYDNPELGNEEYKAVEKLTTFLKEHDFEIKCPVAGLDTAFEAVYDSGKPGLSVAYLCEYDALPELGHGCGHNMIGVISAGAGVAF